MDYEQMKVALGAVAGRAFQRWLDDVCSTAMEQCGSPIEYTFLCALIAEAIDDQVDSEIYSHEDAKWCPVWESRILKLGSLYRLKVTPQWRHERKRVDFHLEFGDRVDYSDEENTYWTSILLVECDGHDFHERTKEQAQKDKSRDRELTAAGFQIFRFTGSELFKDAAACARSCLKHLRAAASKNQRAGDKPRA